MERTKLFSILFFLCITATVLNAQVHPRLFFDQTEIATLQAKATEYPFSEMLQQMKELNARYSTYTEPNLSAEYQESLAAAFGGFLYLITDSAHYALQAKEFTLKRINNATWASSSLKGLSSYWYGTYVSMAYDWCYNSPEWTASFKDSVSKSLIAMGNMIALNGGAEQNTNTASNWQGIRGAAGGICLLATDNKYQPDTLSKSLEKVERYVADNYGDIWQSKGWNIEGLGYTYYPFGNFIGPFAIAIQRANPTIDYKKYAGFRNTYWSIYASLVNSMDLLGFGGMHPDFGDDNPHPSGEGVFGQAFYFLPDSLLPGAKYWYDKVIAVRPQMPYDNYRAGGIWSYIYYPKELSGKTPMQNSEYIDQNIDANSNGYMTYRNKFADTNDLVAQMYLKLRGNKGHAGPDALTYRIFGYGTAWAVGGGRYGTKYDTINNVDVYNLNMNTVYYKNPNLLLKTDINSNSGTIVGTPKILPDGSGHVISSIIKNNVGVNTQKRYFVSDYDSDNTGAVATYIIGDESGNGYYWQLCSHDKNIITTNGNTFTISSTNGSTMQGYIAYPTSNFRYEIGKRIRGTKFGDADSNIYIHFQSDDAKFLVILTVMPQGETHPVINASVPTINSAQITVGSKTYTFTDDDVLYNANAIAARPNAAFTMDKQSGTAPLAINFEANVDTVISLYEWDFGDGTTATGKTVSHIYTSNGTYQPILKVTDQNSNSAMLRSTVALSNISSLPNIKPLLYLSSPPNNSTYLNNDTVFIRHWLSDVDGHITKVEYYSGSNLLGTDTQYPFEFNWKSTIGTHYIKALAYDDKNESKWSDQKKITVSYPTNAETLANNELGISIYPNPANKYIEFKSSDNQNIEYSISDINGKILLTDVAQDGDIVNIESLASGIYFVKLATMSSTATTIKLMKR